MAETQKKIFLVEDDDFLSSMLVKKFEEHGVVVERFSTGRSVLEALEKSVPDLVLLDLYLPETNGFEVLDSIRKDEKIQGLFVVVISNTAQAKDKTYVEERGAQFITKALVTPEEIAQRVDEALAKIAA